MDIPPLWYLSSLLAPEHTIFLKGHRINEIALVDQVDAREVLAIKQHEHLKSKQHQLQRPQTAAAECR